MTQIAIFNYGPEPVRVSSYPGGSSPVYAVELESRIFGWFAQAEYPMTEAGRESAIEDARTWYPVQAASA